MNFDPISKALIQEKERQHRITTLTHVAEEMRKKGASERSIQTALKGFYEFLKPARTPTPTRPDSGQPANPELQPEPSPNLTEEAPGILLSEVQTQEVHWLWERRIPLGKITILDGDPGMGKSLLATSLAACVSTGRPMPDGTPGRQGGVILIAPEDGVALRKLSPAAK